MDKGFQLSPRTLRRGANSLKVHVRRMRQADCMRLRSRPKMGTQAESDAALVHCAWDQLAQTAPQLATALELREYGRLNVRGVATAMGRSLQTGAFLFAHG